MISPLTHDNPVEAKRLHARILPSPKGKLNKVFLCMSMVHGRLQARAALKSPSLYDTVHVKKS